MTTLEREWETTGYCDPCGGPHDHNHMLGRLRYAVRMARHGRPRTFAARARLLWHDFVTHGLRNRGGERCQDCGRDYPLWWSDDVLYELLVGDLGGCFCPDCFDRRAHENGTLLRWYPEIIEVEQ